MRRRLGRLACLVRGHRMASAGTWTVQDVTVRPGGRTVLSARLVSEARCTRCPFRARLHRAGQGADRG